MTAHRFSRLQKRLLTSLAADHQRTGGVTASRHQALVRVAKPNTSGSRWKVKNGRGNSQEGVNKTKSFLKQ
jgi:hypothetical protein